MVSVIIITHNEAPSIRSCLDSVSWADEIIVLDSGSTDETVDICTEYTDNVHRTDWPGFGPQKNRALAKASNPWVLSLDADECVPPALRDEIQTVMATPDAHDAYRMPRLSRYCGRTIHHSGWWPDYVVRLFKRDHASFTSDIVHERVTVDGTTGTLRNPLFHESFTSLEEVIDKMNRYSTAGATMMCDRGESSSISHAVAHGLWSFLYTYVVRRGFLDGREGFMLAVSNAEGTYYRHLKCSMTKRVQI